MIEPKFKAGDKVAYNKESILNCNLTQSKYSKSMFLKSAKYRTVKEISHNNFYYLKGWKYSGSFSEGRLILYKGNTGISKYV